MKILKAIVNIITTIIIVIGIIFIGLYIIGIQPYVVLSGSMEPQVKTGSLSFINKHTKFENIKENDIIAFKMSDKTMVTHRVIKKESDYLETKGDANETIDGIRTTKENYVGKSMFSIPKLGYFIRAIQSTRGKIIFGTFIIFLFVAGILLGEPSKKKET